MASLKLSGRQPGWAGFMLPGTSAFLNLFFLHHRRLLTIMISQSKDGELAAGAAHRLGFSSVRGSSSRGGSNAMYQLIEAMQKPA